MYLKISTTQKEIENINNIIVNLGSHSFFFSWVVFFFKMTSIQILRSMKLIIADDVLVLQWASDEDLVWILSRNIFFWGSTEEIRSGQSGKHMLCSAMVFFHIKTDVNPSKEP